ncbi:unnamed protein product [Zymoseptoria tritici ST99CH_1A5]|uniref:Major facilitator superfamily (MFS) profile domain-containing protein n=3 Tax=Zymoseptoria tritici TaxID=1047171 RepID=F9XE12_ZYMTI|nr:uncharacterized protein MYCGRDRAFT_60310 [Zymoseptoria tritici IPO323]EGP86711.1 hypothetical protein MYCGRDRAFT_60310 [Zymoseptoria tritici IPO323]SMR54549.1 unnamed protein product [Zymoseptoria tritici ST99CH_1E4]SMR56431.1 unnamed protein product [Zymoseptoria tritici ST99CH_3D1]SMY25617.1 unnamed protein product [Zymoseptoria tritici ST99CH_1A5]
MSKDYEKGDVHYDDVVHDSDITGDKSVAADDVRRHAALTEEELVVEKKLRRKMDMIIMPMVVTVYLLNYIDRNNYPAAKLQGLMEELNMTQEQYQLGLSILFVGYVLMQVPSNALLNYCAKPSWYLGFFIIAWGLVSALTSQVHNYKEIVACRFILGIVEAPFFPGVLFYLSKWYTKKELNLRMSIFYSGSLLSGAFGPLIAAGILENLAGERGISAWRWLYIIEGTITVFVGIIIVCFLPDFPDSWKLLSPEMKHVANRRMALDASEADTDGANKMDHWTGLKQAFADPKTYILAISYHGIVAASGFQNFYPTLVRTFNIGNNVQTLLLVAPPYIFMTIYSLCHGLASDRYQKRFWFYVYPIPIVLAGALVFMFTESFGSRYFSLFMLNFVFAMNGTIYAWIANGIPRPPAKRAAALAFINSVGNAASIWTPFTYNDGDRPYYRSAMGINMGMTVVAGASAVAMKFILESQNRQLIRMENEDTPLTDKDMRKLERTAEIEGIDIASARMLQKGYRYIV